jgi:hypothetical protein
MPEVVHPQRSLPIAFELESFQQLVPLPSNVALPQESTTGVWEHQVVVGPGIPGTWDAGSGAHILEAGALG